MQEVDTTHAISPCLMDSLICLATGYNDHSSVECIEINCTFSIDFVTIRKYKIRTVVFIIFLVDGIGL